MSSPPDVVHTVDHLIVGAGFAGLCAAIKLAGGRRDRLRGAREGRRRRRHLARQHLPRRDLRRPEPALLLLVRAATTGRAPTPPSRRSRTTSSRSPASRGRWTGSSSTPPPRTPRGTTRRSAGRCVRRTGTWVSRTLVVGAGGLSEPRLPEIEGIETFQGEVFHSARWNHDVDLAGKRVAVIGTGASAIQIVPELQKTLQATGGHLDVYQRTAPWIIPRNDRVYGRLERAALRRVPGLRRLYRTGLYWAHEAYVPAFTLQPKLAAPARQGGHRRTSRRASRTRSCARRSRRTSCSAASGCCGPTTGTRRWPPTTPSWSPTRSPRSPATRSSPRTASSARSTCWSWRPASTRPSCRSPSTSPAAPAGRWPTAGARPAWRRTRARRSRSSRTCSCWSGPTPARATPA